MKPILYCCLLVVWTVIGLPVSAGSDEVHEASADDANAVKQAVHQVFESIKNGELDELAHHHLNSEDFSKWPDDGSAAVIGFDATVELETAIFSAMKSFEYDLEDLRVAVIGSAAIATFVISYDIAFDGEPMSAAERSTLVFAKDEGDWKIVHEHFSKVTPSPRSSP